MRRKLKWIIIAVVVAVIAAPAIAFVLYTGDYYHADSAALTALESTGSVQVSRTDYGWFLDGPAKEDALIFYPGAKVEATAYAPLLHLLAEEGMDVCLVEMPFRLAFFGTNRADSVMEMYDYPHWYIGGHSLGGAMAAVYAAERGDSLTGLIMFAAYPTKPLNNKFLTMSIYGTEDGLLNMEKVRLSKNYTPGTFLTYVIEGGNHAWFGNYGIQEGDGTATIARSRQQQLAVEFIVQHLR